MAAMSSLMSLVSPTPCALCGEPSGRRSRVLLRSPWGSTAVALRKSSAHVYNRTKRGSNGAVRASETGTDGLARLYETKAAGEVLSGVVLGEGTMFSPTQTIFSDKELSAALVSQDTHHSLARQHYNPASEDAVNGAINVAYAMSYIFHGMYTFFDRDDVGLEHIAGYFKYRSGYEREEAESLMAYQNVRGGRVKLLSLQAPESTEFDDPKKGDALNAFEKTLAMEKIQNDKYLALHQSASEVGDAEMEDFVKKNFLHPQVLKIRRTADFVAQLRRIGLGHGVYHFDQRIGEMGDDYGFSEIDPSRV